MTDRNKKGNGQGKQRDQQKGWDIMYNKTFELQLLQKALKLSTLQFFVPIVWPDFSKYYD